MIMGIRAIVVVLVASLVFTAGQAGAQGTGKPVRVAVFPFELIDTSLDGAMSGPKPQEADRLDMIADQFRDAVSKAPGYEVVDIAPVADEAAQRNLQGCGGCDVALAKEVDADWSVTGTVQKVSNLILNINVYIKDTATGNLAQAYSVDIRGNTDETWRRGMSYLIRNRLDLAR